MKNDYLPWRKLPDDIAIALENEAVLDWSLGILPWTFRRPILASLDAALRENPQLEPLHRAARDALNFLRFDIRHPWDGFKAKELLDFYQDNIGGTAAESVTIDRAFPINQFAVGDKEYVDLSFRKYMFLLSCKRLMELLNENFTMDKIRIVIDIFRSGFLNSKYMIRLSEAKNITIDVDNPRIRAFYFWRWQYVQRNSEYINLRNKADAILNQRAIRISILPLDLEEYCMLPTLQLNLKYRGQDLNNDQIRLIDGVAELNELTEQSRQRFNMLLAWPLPDYDSEVILSRFLSGEFRYWERPTPPSFLIDNPPKISETQGEKFEELWAEYQGIRDEVYSEDEVEGALYEKTLAAYGSAQYEYGKLYSHEVVQRMRIATGSRAIGIWLWDYVHEQGCTGAQAMDKLTRRYPGSVSGRGVIRQEASRP